MTMEMMLIIVALLTVGMMLSKTARSEAWMSSLVTGPWKPLKAIIEDGVWTPDNSKQFHPHHRNRHGSYEADPVTGATSSGEGGLE